jgi:hypothetical protein
MSERVDIQIMNLGVRERSNVTDFIVGFRLYGPVTAKTRVEFYRYGPDGKISGRQKKIVGLWEPTLQNAQGFLELGMMRRFSFPEKFEICGGARIEPAGDALVRLNNESVFMVCFTVGDHPDRFDIMGVVTQPEGSPL